MQTLPDAQNELNHNS